MALVKWVILIAIGYIMVMMWTTVSSVGSMNPVYNTSDSVMVNQTTQNTAITDLVVVLAPAGLLVCAGYVVLRAITGGGL